MIYIYINCHYCFLLLLIIVTIITIILMSIIFIDHYDRISNLGFCSASLLISRWSYQYRKIIKRYEIQQRARYMCSFCGKDRAAVELGVGRCAESDRNKSDVSICFIYFGIFAYSWLLLGTWSFLFLLVWISYRRSGFC